MDDRDKGRYLTALMFILLAVLAVAAIVIMIGKLSGAPAPLPKTPKPYTVKEVSGYYLAYYGGKEFRFYLAEDGYLTSYWNDPPWGGKWTLRGNEVMVREGEEMFSDYHPFVWRLFLRRDLKGKIVRSGYKIKSVQEVVADGRSDH